MDKKMEEIVQRGHEALARGDALGTTQAALEIMFSMNERIGDMLLAAEQELNDLKERVAALEAKRTIN